MAMRKSISAVLIWVAAANTGAAPVPAVVELFTSQGCSSCPPADQLLGELAKRPEIIALAYHVDYWDGLGWHDRFSSSDATARQRAYARKMGSPNVYTPQMVVDGITDMVGSDRAQVTAALKGGRDGILPQIAVADGNMTIGLAAGEAAEVTLVAYAREAETKVARGENAGKSLREYDIVRAIRSLGSWDGQPRQFSFDLKTLPPDCSDVAVLLQKENGRMIGAATASVGAAPPPATP
jgi:hypothetical protein